jgi:hypothetical protein
METEGSAGTEGSAEADASGGTDSGGGIDSEGGNGIGKGVFPAPGKMTVALGGSGPFKAQLKVVGVGVTITGGSPSLGEGASVGRIETSDGKLGSSEAGPSEGRAALGAGNGSFPSIGVGVGTV